MVERQVKIIKEETGNNDPLTRMIFYDELSDLLAEGLLHPPKEKEMIWHFVAARRDHFPNQDIRSVPVPDSVNTWLLYEFAVYINRISFCTGGGAMENGKELSICGFKEQQTILFFRRKCRKSQGTSVDPFR